MSKLFFGWFAQAVHLSCAGEGIRAPKQKTTKLRLRAEDVRPGVLEFVIVVVLIPGEGNP